MQEGHHEGEYCDHMLRMTFEKAQCNFLPLGMALGRDNYKLMATVAETYCNYFQGFGSGFHYEGPHYYQSSSGKGWVNVDRPCHVLLMEESPLAHVLNPTWSFPDGLVSS